MRIHSPAWAESTPNMNNRDNKQFFFMECLWYNRVDKMMGRCCAPWIRYNYKPLTRFLYSLMQASKRSWAVVSPGTLCDG